MIELFYTVEVMLEDCKDKVYSKYTSLFKSEREAAIFYNGWLHSTNRAAKEGIILKEMIMFVNNKKTNNRIGQLYHYKEGDDICLAQVSVA